MTTVLLDTHIVLWWFQGAGKLSARAKGLLRDPEVTVMVSAVSAWEIAIKYKAGKLDAARAVVSRFQAALEEEHFVELPITVAHAVHAGLLEGFHKDPFDRMLIAQARIESLPVVSTDKCFDDFKVERVW
ncbi:MAG TPA: type II toxin-antitoxin system VapC family toxin [Candidatus Acidoferrum sp.]|nr:type II toxin-antitoxin system VapC family toxin [Candidatus Acidoferrum sp.]